MRQPADGADDATARARRSDALYYGSVKRRELCDMVAHLEHEVERLRRAASGPMNDWRVSDG